MSPKVSDQHRADRRSELLKSALHCFSEQGYEATTVDDIVRGAGVSKGMIYTYFTSKEEIFLELVKDRTEIFITRMEEVFRSLPTAWDKLRYLLEFYRVTPPDADGRKWIAVYLEFFLSSARSEARLAYMQQRYHQFLQIFIDVVDEGKQTGEFRKNVDSAAVSGIYWALCDGIHLHLSQLTNIRDYDALYQTAIEMVYGHVVNKSESK